MGRGSVSVRARKRNIRAQYSYSVLPGHVALTFDDGPDPEWTPRILAELAKYHVPGTFSLVGSRVAEDPALVRAWSSR